MEVNVTFRHIAATEPLRRYAEEKVQRIAKYLHRPIDAHVILSVVKRRHIAEIVMNADRTTLNAEGETHDLYSAIDAASEKLEQRARKHTSKIRSHKVREGQKVRDASRRRVADVIPLEAPVRGSGLRVNVIRADSFTQRNGPEIITSTRMPVKPMSVEEAVMQMDLMSNDFLVFRNAATELLSVVYRRKDGNYGLIEPDAP